MKIGVQILAYNCHKTFEELINPWVKLKENYDLKIWVGSGQFKQYAELEDKNLNGPTIGLLDHLLQENKIDYLFQPNPDNLLEDFSTRDKCVSWLKENDIDLMIQVDADEFYTESEALNVIKFIESNPEPSVYDIQLQNKIGDNKFKDWSRFVAAWVKRHGGISHYYFDCHWSFQEGEYRKVSSIIIPKEVANPIHYTWTNKDNTTGPSHIKLKVDYQNKIYGDGCGYEWNEGLQTIVQKGEDYNLINLIFSTARRYDLFSITLNSLMQHNPTLNRLINKVYVLDDRSSWEDRKKMEKDLLNYFPSKVTTLAFNNDKPFGYIDKLNFIKYLKEEAEYFLFIEDDWESIRPLNLEQHISFLRANKEIDLINFGERWELTQGMLEVEDLSDEWKRAIMESPINEIYFKNPYPYGYNHCEGVENGAVMWRIVSINNFSLNPGLFRTHCFDEEFDKKKGFEFHYGKKSNLKQIFTRLPIVNHIGYSHSLSN